MKATMLNDDQRGSAKVGDRTRMPSMFRFAGFVGLWLILIVPGVAGAQTGSDPALAAVCMGDNNTLLNELTPTQGGVRYRIGPNGNALESNRTGRFSFEVGLQPGSPNPAGLITRVEVLRMGATGRAVEYSACGRVWPGARVTLPDGLATRWNDTVVVTFFGRPTGSYMTSLDERRVRERLAVTPTLEPAVLAWLAHGTDARPLARHELPAQSGGVVVSYDAGREELDRPSTARFPVVLLDAPQAGRLWMSERDRPSQGESNASLLGRFFSFALAIMAIDGPPPLDIKVDDGYLPLVPFGARTVFVGHLGSHGSVVSVCADANCPTNSTADTVRNHLVFPGEHSVIGWTVFAVGLGSASERADLALGRPRWELDSTTPAVDMDTPLIQHYTLRQRHDLSDAISAGLALAVTLEPEAHSVRFMFGLGPSLSTGGGRFQGNLLAGIGYGPIFLVAGLGLRASQQQVGALGPLDVPLGESPSAPPIRDSVEAVGTFGFGIDLAGLGELAGGIVKAVGGP